MMLKIQEPGCARGEARGRGGGNNGDEEDGEDADAFHVPHRHMDTPDGETIVDHLAGVEDYTLAMATYRAAIKRWPNTPITLRQGARVIEDSRCLRLAETNKSRQSGR